MFALLSGRTAAVVMSFGVAAGLAAFAPLGGGAAAFAGSSTAFAGNRATFAGSPATFAESPAIGRARAAIVETETQRGGIGASVADLVALIKNRHPVVDSTTVTWTGTDTNVVFTGTARFLGASAGP
ncbi:hypothetical protein [Actinoplanes couchii]|uniref:Uncharacterized protein n=1 Tax=Actinoplanes couchii TaxID=403638 RepID=A0ABQ3XL07_9ACTN|nr:hypothetical protein [Actinoplanes couchii]MDR6319411.1 hypothetical protein [Actinoplanes couchii]GID59199.1 hypothetical protein Aco03nite_076030 [Actinoplanes couchii]